MKSTLLFLSLCICGIINASTPAWQWAKKATGLSTDRGYGISLDSSGNCYAIGTNGSANLNFDFNVTTGKPYFIVKYDLNGNGIWVTGPTAGNAEYTAIATDPGGNSYVAGVFNGDSMTLGAFTLFNSIPITQNDMFVAKYDANGNVLWAKKISGTDYDYASRICLDNNGNFYVTGEFLSPTLSFDINTSLTYGGLGGNNNDCFVAKYDVNGNVQWARSGTNADGIAVCADASGNCYVTGSGYLSLFGADSLTHLGFFLVKYDVSGNQLWIKGVGNTSGSPGTGVGVDAWGNIYCCGYLNSATAIFQTTTITNYNNFIDVFVVKYDPSGNLLFAKRYGGDGDDWPTNIKVDPNGNFFLTGYFDGNTIILGTLSFANSNLQQNIFVAEFNNVGVPYWVQGSTDGGLDTKANDLAIDNNDNVYIVGTNGDYNNNVNFDFFMLTLCSPSRDDFIIAKLGNTTGIQSFQINKSLDVFPNPSSDQTFVAIPNGIDRDGLQMKVYDVLGNCVETKTNFTSDKIEIDTQTPGTYFVELSDKNGIIIGRSKFVRTR